MNDTKPNPNWQQTDEPPSLDEIEQGVKFQTNYDQEQHPFPVVTNEFKQVCSARFGPGRVCWTSNDGKSETKWSGDSYRYDIFQRNKSAERGNEWALRWCNGGGKGWLLCDNLSSRDETCLLEMIAEMPEEKRRWDACHFLYETAIKMALAAARTARGEVIRAFVDGRLVKRKNRGENTYKVNILPKLMQAD